MGGASERLTSQQAAAAYELLQGEWQRRQYYITGDISRLSARVNAATTGMQEEVAGAEAVAAATGAQEEVAGAEAVAATTGMQEEVAGAGAVMVKVTDRETLLRLLKLCHKLYGSFVVSLKANQGQRGQILLHALDGAVRRLSSALELPL